MASRAAGPEIRKTAIPARPAAVAGAKMVASDNVLSDKYFSPVTVKGLTEINPNTGKGKNIYSIPSKLTNV